MSKPDKVAGRVVVVGTLNVDLIWQVPALPRPGETILADAVQRQFGGKGANQAVAAARQGAEVVLIGAVGDDAEGRSYREHLRRERIATDDLVVASGVATGTAHVYVDPRGENLIVVDRGANAQLEPARLERVLRSDDLVLVQLECGLEAALAALRIADAAGVRGVLNASPTHPDFPWGTVALSTVIVNEHECVESFGRSAAELLAADGPTRRRLLGERRVEHLVITRGPDATLHFSSEEVDEIASFPVEARDTVGAGDTFAGTLAALLAEGQAWPEALRHANVAAGLSTLAVGAQAAMPTRAEVEARMARAGR